MSVAASLLIGATGYFIWRDVKSAPVRAHIASGVELLQSGRSVAAEQQWLEAIRLDPNNAETWELLSDFYFQNRSYREAGDAMNHLAILKSDVPDLQLRMAFCALQLKDLSTARRYAESALKQSPKNIDVLQTLAEIEDRSKQPEARINYLKRIVELQPQNVSALSDLVATLGASQEYDKVLPLSNQLIKMQPTSPSAYSARGVALFTLNPDPQALLRAKADFHKVLELDPNNTEAHRYLGRIFLQTHQPGQAIIQFEAIGRGRPYASAHLLELSTAYRQAGNPRRADELRLLFTQINEFNLKLLNMRKAIELRPQEFKNYLNISIAIMDGINSNESFYQLYRYRYIEGEVKDVSYYLSKCVKIQPRSREAKFVLSKKNATYNGYLKSTNQALQSGNNKLALDRLTHAVLLDAHDIRTQHALHQLSARGFDLFNVDTVK